MNSPNLSTVPFLPPRGAASGGIAPIPEVATEDRTSHQRRKKFKAHKWGLTGRLEWSPRLAWRAKAPSRGSHRARVLARRHTDQHLVEHTSATASPPPLDRLPVVKCNFAALAHPPPSDRSLAAVQADLAADKAPIEACRSVGSDCRKAVPHRAQASRLSPQSQPAGIDGR